MENKYTLVIQMAMREDIDVSTLYDLVENMLRSYVNKTESSMNVHGIVIHKDFVDLNNSKEIFI